MKRLHFTIWRKQMNTLRLVMLLIGAGFFLNSCFLKQDRTTVVYGTITDQNGQPVDSILVVMNGVKGFRYDRLQEYYSDALGNYEIVNEVPKGYSTAVVLIPAQSDKFYKNYKEYSVRKNGEPTNTCCYASIGQKTKYDFQLISK